MSNPKSTRMQGAITVLNLFLACFAIRLAEQLLIYPQLRVSTQSMLTSVLGTCILIFYLYNKSKNFGSVGLIFRGKKIWKGFRNAVVINLITIPIGYLVEYFAVRGYYHSAPSFRFSSGDYIPSFPTGVNFLIHLIIVLVVSFFFESLFRGLFLRLATKSFSHRKSILYQAAFYSIWSLAAPLMALLYLRDSTSPKMLALLFVFYLVYGFINGIRWGYSRYASGALWMPIFDRIIMTMITDSIFAAVNASSLRGTLFEMGRDMLISVLALVLVMIYSHYKIPANTKKYKLDYTPEKKVFDPTLEDKDVAKKELGMM